MANGNGRWALDWLLKGLLAVLTAMVGVVWQDVQASSAAMAAIDRRVTLLEERCSNTRRRVETLEVFRDQGGRCTRKDCDQLNDDLHQMERRLDRLEVTHGR